MGWSTTREENESLELLSLPILHRQSLSERAVTALKGYLLQDGVQAGDRLPPERQLAEALNVSRTVLREALSQLIGAGLIRRESPRRLQVADFDRGQLRAELAQLQEVDTSLQDLIELRVFVEIGALEVIVQRLNDEHLAAIEYWVRQGEERLAAHEPLMLVDAHFHAALLAATDNQAIAAILPIIEENLRQSVRVSPRQFAGSGRPDDYRVVAEHRQIFEALRRRDANAARMLMAAHLSFYLHRDWRHPASGRPAASGEGRSELPAVPVEMRNA